MDTMGQNEKMPQRYFNHCSPKDQPKFWWYFRFLEIGSKVRTTISKWRFSDFVFQIIDS
jgi:hypothetical protein